MISQVTKELAYAKRLIYACTLHLTDFTQRLRASRKTAKTPWTIKMLENLFS